MFISDKPSGVSMLTRCFKPITGLCNLGTVKWPLQLPTIPGFSRSEVLQKIYPDPLLCSTLHVHPTTSNKSIQHDLWNRPFSSRVSAAWLLARLGKEDISSARRSSTWEAKGALLHPSWSKRRVKIFGPFHWKLHFRNIYLVQFQLAKWDFAIVPICSQLPTQMGNKGRMDTLPLKNHE